jgi:hypothetical protein
VRPKDDLTSKGLAATKSTMADTSTSFYSISACNAPASVTLSYRSQDVQLVSAVGLRIWKEPQIGFVILSLARAQILCAAPDRLSA